jgi:YD repeat-containing protein
MVRGVKCALFFLAVILAGCTPAEELIETGNLISKAEMFNAKGDRIAYSDFTYDGRGRLIGESHYNGVITTKTVLEYDDRDRLKTRTDDALGQHPVKLEYAYAADGKTVNVKQTREDAPAQEMNNLLENGVLVGRNWGKDVKNTLAFKIETQGNKTIRTSFTDGQVLRSTETLTFDDAGKLTGLAYQSRSLTESRRYDYDGARLIKESILDDHGKTTLSIVYSYATAKVFKSFADVHNYLHLDGLIEEVKGKKAK